MEKHIITAAELIRIQEVTLTGQESKNKTRKHTKEPISGASRSTEESEVELELSDDDATEILDCIEVEL